jgi:hypothetical protein
MNRYLAALLIMFLFTLGINSKVYSSTTVLTTCSQSDVSSAILSAADGDTIICPAGSWTWSNSVSINNKNITLKGAGKDQTIISIALAGGLNVPVTNTKAFRITGFTFRSTINIGTDSGYAMVRIYGGKGWRIDNNKIKIYSNVLSYNGGNGIYTKNAIGGLIDHNEFTNEETSTNCWHAAVYVEGAGSNAWSSGSQIGNSNNTVFIENNTFTETRQCSAHNPHAVYGQNGGIFVVRHNTITNVNIDTHGFCAIYGTREYEISKNNWIISTGRNLFRLIYLRGGTGVIHNNTLTLQGTGTATYGIGLTDYRITAASQCSGTATQNLIKANTCCSASEGYPCIDQIGRGQNQVLDPLYIWNNANFRTTTVSNVSSECSSSTSNFIQLNRDYFVEVTKPGYIAYQYPHPLTGDPCVENCGEGQLPRIPYPPIIDQVK